MALGKYARCKGMLTMVPKRCFNFQFPYVYKFSLDLKKEHNVTQEKSNFNTEFLARKTITSSA